MLTFLILFGITFIMFLIIDLLWLGLIAKNLYQKYLGHLLTPDVNWFAAIIFYVLFIIGLVFFVVEPAVEQSNLWYAIGAGTFFGFITYATYDLTNLATLKTWPVKITIIDLIWGSFLGGTTSTLAYLVYQIIF